MRIVEPWGETTKSSDDLVQLHVQQKLLPRAVHLDLHIRIEVSESMGEISRLDWVPGQNETSDSALFQANDFYQHWFEQAPIACFSIGANGGIRAANSHALELLGYRLNEVMGRPVFDLYANSLRGKQKAQEVFLRFRAGAEITREHLEMRRANGSPISINLSVRPIRGSSGYIVASCSVVEEIVGEPIPCETAAVVSIPSPPVLAWHSCRPEKHQATRWIVKSAKGFCFLNVEEIDWIEAAGNYAQLHVGSKVQLVRETMNRLEARLDSCQFIRVHRRAIVNVARMKELQPCSSGDYRLTLTDGTRLTLSRTYREKLKGVWLS